MQQRPVLYLDLDDTVISWAGGKPSGAAGLGEFLTWALDVFEVRWLTRWARGGEMEPRLLHDLSYMSGVSEDRLRTVQGVSWDNTDSKLNGIAWLDHIVLQRPFIWIEDETIGTAATDFLARHGFENAHICCNVTRDPDALHSVHGWLAQKYAPSSETERRGRTA